MPTLQLFPACRVTPKQEVRSSDKGAGVPRATFEMVKGPPPLFETVSVCDALRTPTALVNESEAGLNVKAGLVTAALSEMVCCAGVALLVITMEPLVAEPAAAV